MNQPSIPAESPVAAALERSAGNVSGLVAIIVAVVLGALFGALYGQSMWLASGGPTEAMKIAEKTAAQKRQFAREAAAESARLALAGRKDEARRLLARSEQLMAQAAANDRRVAELRALAAEAERMKQDGRDWLPHAAFQLTRFCGDLFLQVLKLLVIPLVVTSMIVGITSLGDIRRLGRVGGWTIAFYVLTMAVAVSIGIALVEIIRPGMSADDTYAYVSEKVPVRAGALETLLNVFRGDPDKPGSGMFPSNIFEAASQTNVLALIVFALVFGGALTTIGERGQVVIDFFRATNEVVMKMVLLVMFVAPVGIFGLVATKIAEQGGGAAFYDQLRLLAWYVGTVGLGLAIHFLLLTATVGVLARRNPLKYLYAMLRGLLTAGTTASSSATLPVTMECVELGGGVSNRAASFVLPLGATINMDGTALYEAVAAIFIAQAAGIELSAAQLLIIFFTATLAAVGAAGIPEAGLFTMVMVLTAVGLPIEGVGIILAIDWFLDRLRTTVNVYGDMVAAAVIDERVVRGNS